MRGSVCWGWARAGAARAKRQSRAQGIVKAMDLGRDGVRGMRSVFSFLLVGVDVVVRERWAAHPLLA